MTGTAGPVSPCFAQAVARQLQGAGTPDGAPGNLSPARGWVIIQADNKGLSSKHPPPPPRHCGFSRPRRGRLGAPSRELTRGHSYAGGLPLNKVRLFCQSPGDSEPRHSDSLAPRPCLALRDAQPGPFSPQSRAERSCRLAPGPRGLCRVSLGGSTTQKSFRTGAWRPPSQGAFPIRGGWPPSPVQISSL